MTASTTGAPPGSTGGHSAPGCRVTEERSSTLPLNAPKMEAFPSGRVTLGAAPLGGGGAAGVERQACSRFWAAFSTVCPSDSPPADA
ncbi:unnamed protein product [Gadus morhua 'NCC']